MNCELCQELLWEDINGRLEADQLATVEDHLNECLDCSSVRDDLRANTNLPQQQKQSIEEQKEEYVALGLFGTEIKLVSFTQDEEYKILDEYQNSHRIFHAGPETLSLQDAIDELETLVNDPKVKEQAFQSFFERNSDFILNDDYKEAHPHIVLTNEDRPCLIPDFVLEPFDQESFCDLLELKLPSAPVFVLKKNRARFSAAVYEARAQLLEYARYFDEQKNRNAIYELYGLKAWRPTMFVIIGRRGKIDPFARRGIEIEEPNLRVKNYDEILDRMKGRLQRMKMGGLKARGRI